MNKDQISIFTATGYLLIYVILFQLNAPAWLLGIIFLLSPILVLWMVYQILKNGKYSGQELGMEEFGYQDADKNKLGLF